MMLVAARRSSRLGSDLQWRCFHYRGDGAKGRRFAKPGLVLGPPSRCLDANYHCNPKETKLFTTLVYGDKRPPMAEGPHQQVMVPAHPPR